MEKLPKEQSTSAKRAEANRPFRGDAIVADPTLGQIFRESADAAIRATAILHRRDIPLSPFLEIGAGSGQRSAALINNFASDGAASDISQNSLRDCPYIMSLLGWNKQPLLIACDAHHLPFLSNTFRLVFAYQCLHHFENLIPVVAECYRVLASGGHFFFDEEPLDSSMRRRLRGNRMLKHPPTTIQRIAYKLGVEKVFWDDGASERSVGITEARFDFELWQRSLRPFKHVDLEVNRKLKIRFDLDKTSTTAFLAQLVGGNVKGLCLKDEGTPFSGDFFNRLMCVDCLASLSIHSPIETVTCANCGRAYLVTYGVLRMLPADLEEALNTE